MAADSALTRSTVAIIEIKRAEMVVMSAEEANSIRRLERWNAALASKWTSLAAILAIMRDLAAEIIWDRLLVILRWVQVKASTTIIWWEVVDSSKLNKRTTIRWTRLLLVTVFQQLSRVTSAPPSMQGVFTWEMCSHIWQRQISKSSYMRNLSRLEVF